MMVCPVAVKVARLHNVALPRSVRVLVRSAET